MTNVPLKKFAWLALVLILLLTACSPAATAQPTSTVVPNPSPAPSATPSMLTFSDDLGRTIQLAQPAQKIVALGPSITESLFALGAGGQIVGRDELSLFPEQAQQISSIGSLFGNLPSEAILALEPDLVIAPEIISQEQLQTLESLGLTVYYQTNPLTFTDLYQKIDDLAALTGREKEADQLVFSLQSRVQAVQSALEGADTQPRVFYELDATDPENPYTAGAGTFIDTLISMAGGENIGAALESQYAQISSEQVILDNPEVILLTDAEFGVTPEVVAARPGWDKIRAVEEGRMYPYDPNLGSIPGPRLVDGLETMASLFHPDLYQK
jgi:iron complex transport system substrate-binding protein